jgi:hypothetical protein
MVYARFLNLLVLTAIAGVLFQAGCIAGVELLTALVSLGSTITQAATQ